MEKDDIRENGQVNENGIFMMSIIGEIEGHECASSNTKSTKYEHLIPKLAQLEEDKSIKGVLIMINSQGGDVSAGLAIAEMIQGISKPTVSLVIGDSHSISVPLAVAADYSYIAPSATMIVHPVRMGGLVIGAQMTYDYIQRIQDRIVAFVSSHSNVKSDRLEEMMMNTKMLTKDLGTILVGEDAVREGLIDAVGGVADALNKLHGLIEKM